MWILILMVGAGMNFSVTQYEFTSKLKCNTALNQLNINPFHLNGETHGICVEK